MEEKYKEMWSMLVKQYDNFVGQAGDFPEESIVISLEVAREICEIILKESAK